MSAERVFVDTNVLAYVFDGREPEKRKLAAAALDVDAEDVELVVSTQVLQELYVCLTRGTAPIATRERAESAVTLASGYSTVQVDVPLIREAIRRVTELQLSFWDALIVSAAVRAGCSVLLSEDFGEGRVLDGVRVVSPFSSS